MYFVTGATDSDSQVFEALRTPFKCNWKQT